jgi:hypothetical protein
MRISYFNISHVRILAAVFVLAVFVFSSCAGPDETSIVLAKKEQLFSSAQNGVGEMLGQAAYCIWQ